MSSSILVLKNLNEMLDWRLQQRVAPGVVMTMGNLHAGHLSLVQTSAAKHETTLITIFVNPKQFGPHEDYESYPRTLEADLLLLDNLRADYPHRQFVVFAPTKPQDIYGETFVTSVKVDHYTKILCGLSRPTHFEGVTTVVSRLLGLTKPEVAYFGQKDYQQFFVIKKMVEDLLLPFEIRCCPIVRDHDGLALSSRNMYLSSEERKLALNLSKAIAHLSLEMNPDLSALENLNLVNGTKNQYSNFEYLEILDADTLQELTINTKTLLIAGALRVGKTRLIDNALIKLNLGVSCD